MYLRIEKKIDFDKILPPDAFLGDYARHPAGFSNFFHFGPDQVDEKISSLKDQPVTQGLIEYLFDYHQNLQASRQTMDNITRLASPEALAVMTGQQPGLLTGPLYTIYKTIACLQEAQRTSHNFPCIPVFWIASEDHNLEESTSLFWPNDDYKAGYQTMSIRPRRGHFKQPAGLLPLEGKKLDAFIQGLEKIFSPTPHSDKIRQIVQDSLARSKTLGEWFARLMMTLFEGLVLLEANDRKIKQLTRPIWEKILADPLALPEIVNQAGQELVRCGYKKQLSLHPGRCPFFLYEQQRRERVRWDGRVFQTQNQAYSTEQLREILHLQPERFSPNVYIRPILSEFLFPTLFYLAGPGEMGYFAQIKGVYEYFGLKMPILLPRFSATLRETRSHLILQDPYPQERKLNIFYLLNLYGLDFLRAIQELEIKNYLFHYQVLIE